MSDLTGDQYIDLIDIVTMACRSFNALTGHITDDQLVNAAAIVDRTDSIGFVIDPTRYREALADRRLDKQRALIAAVRAFRASMREIESMK